MRRAAIPSATRCARPYEAGIRGGSNWDIIKAGAIAYGSAQLFNGIGTQHSQLQGTALYAARASSHAVAGGLVSVAQGGDFKRAMYSVPIAVPPGTGGIAPSLKLDYSSQAGNGLLGAGWSLSDLPAITRCPQTPAQDGQKRPLLPGRRSPRLDQRI